MPSKSPFKLPGNWYADTIKRLVEDELPPILGPLDRSTAWKYVVACVMWAEKVKDVGGVWLHLNDRLSTKAGRELAARGLEYLDEHLATDGRTLDHIDQIAHAYSEERSRQGFSPTSWQRNNVTGRSFESVLQELIHQL